MNLNEVRMKKEVVSIVNLLIQFSIEFEGSINPINIIDATVPGTNENNQIRPKFLFVHQQPDHRDCTFQS